jgi:hypothetical protein
MPDGGVMSVSKEKDGNQWKSVEISENQWIL